MSGDDVTVVPPVPIPNTAVKHCRADDSITRCQNRTLPDYSLNLLIVCLNSSVG